MKIKEFVTAANGVKSDSIKEKRINGMLNTKQYVKTVDKLSLADRVVKSSTQKYDSNNNVVGFELHSPSKYLLHVMGIVDLYTDLEVEYNNKEVSLIDQYDMLNENGLMEIIIQQIGEKEITECQMYLDMVWNDTIQNNLSTHAFIKNQVERFGTLAGATLSPMIESLTKAVDGLDDEKVKTIIDAIENR